MTTHTFDIAWDCPVADFLQFLVDHNLTLVSFIPVGPAGGNPEITVSGSPNDIEEFKAIM